MTLYHSRRKLSILWFSLGAVLFMIYFIQTIAGKFDDKVGDAWTWLLNNTIPTLSLIVGSYVADTSSENINSRIVDKFFFNLSYYLSMFYLSIILLLVISSPITQSISGSTIIELQKKTSYFLTPLQGLISTAIGAFFIKQK